ncbi:MAG: tyrosine-type recombinase/integrase [Proteobacteria bacterium]|nr:tyrosine-type recombinase/integrase [Pseudomonadota bacterium]
MSLYKRGKIYWIKFVTPKGETIRRSTGTSEKTLAQEYHDQLKAEYWRVSRLKVKPKRSWQDAVERWLIEVKDKASIDTDIMHLRYLDTFLGNKMLSDINADILNEISFARQKDGVSNSTINRAFEIIRAILRKARDEWEWIDCIPKIKLLSVKQKRIRWITVEEAQRLVNASPSHQKALIRFSLATGLRMSNVTQLEWSQVDLNRRIAWIHPDQAKARKAIAVPLNTDAMEVLTEAKGKHERYVFTFSGKPIKEANTKAFKKALTKADIADFRWHDLRHTWASWHAQNGTPLYVLKELGGWESMEMVQRYAHLASEHTASYANNVELYNESGTKKAQSHVVPFRSKTQRAC